MTPKTILKALSQGHEELPQDALLAALERRTEMAPLFLAEIDATIAKIEAIEAEPGGERQRKVRTGKLLRKPSPLFYIFFLMATWKETAAYQGFAKLLRFPLIGHDNLLGEPAMEEASYRIMGSLFDGDAGPLHDVILDPDANESVRFWQWHTIVLLALEGALSRETTAAFVRGAFDELEKETQSLVWSGWEKTVSRLGLAELAPLAKKAHEAEYIPESDYETFEADLAYALANPEQPCAPGDGIEPFKGLMAELAPWIG